MYQTNNAEVTVTAAAGCSITSVTFTFTVSNTGTLKYGDDVLESDTSVSINSLSSALFTVGNSTSATNGQVKITAIEVEYNIPSVSVNSVAIRFGATISKDNWDALNAKWTITDYGVMLLQKTTLDSYHATYNTVSSVEDAYRHNDPLNPTTPVTIKHKNSGDAPYLDENNNYLFTVKINIANSSEYFDDVLCAAPFIVAGGQYYFLEEMQESVNSLAHYYLNHGGSNLSDEALTILKGNYGG